MLMRGVLGSFVAHIVMLDMGWGGSSVSVGEPPDPVPDDACEHLGISCIHIQYTDR